MNWQGSWTSQRGTILLESLLAVAILGTIAVVFLGAMCGCLFGADIIEEHFIAANLIRTQLEEIKSQPYNIEDQYTVTVSPPPEYTVLIDVTDLSPEEHPDSLQKTAVTVLRAGKHILTVETLKVNR